MIARQRTAMTKRKDPADCLPHGRPQIYTEELAASICMRLSGGESLRSICNQEGMPCQQTVYSWIFSRPSFLEKYTRAREEQAETMADEIVAIADETPQTAPVFNTAGMLGGFCTQFKNDKFAKYRSSYHWSSCYRVDNCSFF